MFAGFLDETMTYSSAWFEHEAEDLAVAQRRKIDAILDLAGVREGTRPLEIGTGCDELALRAAYDRRILADSYAHTLFLWRKRFLDAWPRVTGLGFDATFRRMWEFYLAYSEAGFRAEYPRCPPVRSRQTALSVRKGTTHCGWLPFPGDSHCEQRDRRGGRLNRSPGGFDRHRDPLDALEAVEHERGG